jgi:hypothetical protein
LNLERKNSHPQQSRHNHGGPGVQAFLERSKGADGSHWPKVRLSGSEADH